MFERLGRWELEHIPSDITIGNASTKSKQCTSDFLLQVNNVYVCSSLPWPSSSNQSKEMRAVQLLFQFFYGTTDELLCLENGYKAHFMLFLYVSFRMSPLPIKY